eukprot:9909812-Karenia_brevis.AAC.1
MGLLRGMLEESRIKILWAQASMHRHGAGMEHGLDLTVTTKHYNWYIKRGKMSQAGVLMAVLTGALWLGERLEEGGPMHKCPHCQRD